MFNFEYISLDILNIDFYGKWDIDFMMGDLGKRRVYGLGEMCFGGD